jgi:hypothetical protein
MEGFQKGGDMRRILIFSLLFVWAIFLQPRTFLTAQDSSLMTDGYPNGRMWKTMSEPSKIWFVRGIFAGLSLCDDKTRQDHGAYTHTFMEYVSVIDAFYLDAANAPVEVVGAYEYATAKMKGFTPKELEEYAAWLRKGTYRKK